MSDDADLRLHLYADGALDADATATLEADLERDPQLRERLEEIRQFQDHLGGQLGAVAAAPEMPAARRMALMARVGAVADRARRRRRWLVVRYAAAACLVVGALGIGAASTLTTYKSEVMDEPAATRSTAIPAQADVRYAGGWSYGEDGADGKDRSAPARDADGTLRWHSVDGVVGNGAPIADVPGPQQPVPGGVARTTPRGATTAYAPVTIVPVLPEPGGTDGRLLLRQDEALKNALAAADKAKEVGSPIADLDVPSEASAREEETESEFPKGREEAVAETETGRGRALIPPSAPQRQHQYLRRMEAPTQAGGAVLQGEGTLAQAQEKVVAGRADEPPAPAGRLEERMRQLPVAPAAPAAPAAAKAEPVAADRDHMGRPVSQSGEAGDGQHRSRSASVTGTAPRDENGLTDKREAGNEAAAKGLDDRTRATELQHIAAVARGVAHNLNLQLAEVEDDARVQAGPEGRRSTAGDAAGLEKKDTGSDERRAGAEPSETPTGGHAQTGTAAPGPTFGWTTNSGGVFVPADRAVEPADWYANLLATAPAPTPVHPWVLAERDAFSTFALTADSAAYRLARRCVAMGRLPPPGLVRSEEFINAIDYRWPARGTDTFAVHAEGGPAPFAARGAAVLAIGVKARVLGRDGRLPAHLVLAIDASGSMDRDDRLPLLKSALGRALATLDPRDRVTVVAFSNDARLVAQGIRAGDAAALRAAVEPIAAGGASNLAGGLALAVQQARASAAPGESARVILCSDGVANLGETAGGSLVTLVEDARRAGVALSTVGVGIGGSDDALLADLARRGDGNHLRLDPDADALAAFASGFSATLATVAKDAKVQVEFDPAVVRRWRQIGWERRALTREQFRDDTVDAGEIGSGQTATALYEIEPLPGRDPARALGTVRVRWQDLAGGGVREFVRALGPELLEARAPSQAWRLELAACAAELAELMRGSGHARDGSFAAVADRLARLAADRPDDAAVRDLLWLARAAHGLPRP